VTLTPGAFGPTLDGREIVGEFGTRTSGLARIRLTSWGDRVQAECDPVHVPGSELDQMLVQDGSIEAAVTGNLEQGNQFVLFLDTVAGGESTLDGNAGRINGMVGDTLPMEADFALVVNIWSGTAYVDLITLATDSSSYIGRWE